MNKQRLLWTLIAANILFAFASVGAEGFFGWTLPPELATYRHTRFAELPWSSVGSMFHFIVLAATTLVAFAAWIALASSWRYARGLYLVSMAMSVFLVLVSGPVVTTSISAVFGTLDGLVSGAIIGLVYFSELARQFDRAPAPSTAAHPSMRLPAEGSV